MADPEQIRQYYNLSEEFNSEWTEPKAFSDIDLGSAGDSSSSKYALLRQIVSSSSVTSDLPQDEPDPLGSTNSVVSVLRSRGVDVSDFTKRNRYLISSTTFSPRHFLRDVHPDATYNNLVNSLNYLESTISERSEALRYLVEHDYDRFVQSKSSLDSVFKNIQTAGFNDSDSSLGFQHLKALIDDSNAKATIIMKPVMDNKAKDERLRTALSLVDGNKYLFNLPSLILTHIKNNDHDSLIRDYRRGKDMRSSENEILSSSESLTNKMEQQRVLERIWNEVEEIVDEYKMQEWKILANTTAEQNYLSIITKLLELGVEDNPIFEWISSQTSQFELDFESAFDKLSSTTDNYRINILTIPQNPAVPLLNAIKALADTVTASASISSSTVMAGNPPSDSSMSSSPASNKDSIIFDSPSVIEMWLTVRIIFQDINNLISKFCIFWKHCKEFMDGVPQRNLPTGWQNESKTHLAFTESELHDIENNGKKIVNLISSRVEHFFSDVVPKSKPNNDISSRENSIALPEDSPQFLPPFSNSLSSVKYLSKIMYLLASGFNELDINFKSREVSKLLQGVLTNVREKAILAIIHAWEQDATVFCLIEDWIPSKTLNSIKTPEYFYAYQITVLTGVGDVLKLSNAGQSIDGEVIPQISATLVKQIQGCFYNTVSATLDSVMRLVIPLEKGDRRKSALNRLSIPTSFSKLYDATGSTSIDRSLKNEEGIAAFELLPDNMNEEKKILLILSSLEQIRDDKLPQLFKLIDTSMRTNSREASSALKSSIDTMANTLFELYNRRKKTLLAEGLRQGILKSGIGWSSNVPEKPIAVSSYIYECLLNLVVVHSRVTEISPGQVPRVITVLYDHVVKTLLSCYREIEQFGRYGLLQAIADIGLIRVTMERLQTPEMLQNYSLIYDCVKEATLDRKALWESKTPPWEIIHPLVLQAQSSSKTEFRCFLNAK